MRNRREGWQQDVEVEAGALSEGEKWNLACQRYRKDGKKRTWLRVGETGRMEREGKTVWGTVAWEAARTEGKKKSRMKGTGAKEKI